MKHIKIISIAIASLLASNMAMAKSGPYVQGQLGVAKNNLNSGIPSNSYFNTTNHDFAGRISAGYMGNLTEKWQLGGEIGWGHYGSMDFTGNAFDTSTAKITATDLALVTSYQLAPKIELLAKGGTSIEKLSSTKDLGFGATTNTTKAVPMAGIGIGYDFTSKLQANLNYTHTFGDDMSATSTGVPTLDTVMAGLKYSF